MKISHDNAWKIERDDGTVVELDMYEASALQNAMNREWLRNEVSFRFDHHSQWKEIQECMDDIIDDISEDLFYEDDTVISDAVWHSVEKWVDLEESDDDV